MEGSNHASFPLCVCVSEERDHQRAEEENEDHDCVPSSEIFQQLSLYYINWVSEVLFETPDDDDDDDDGLFTSLPCWCRAPHDDDGRQRENEWL